ncbi:hypothetical protein BGZ60DRAFT_540602 [Tricladium varicosporioides]|nr:hypothetical protein BGZ60DRAFT_540602 [Hymenoscyphus varicosporioides]
MTRNRVIFRGWRVEDRSSRAHFEQGKGILAGTNVYVPFYPNTVAEYLLLVRYIRLHLDWENLKPTPFISVYNNRNCAVNEARRRRDRIGKKGVVIYEVVIRVKDKHACGGIYWKKMTEVMEELEEEIPDYVGGNADHEVIFLHKIPAKLVRRVKF